MTPASTAPLPSPSPSVSSRIETALREALSPTRLEVVNDSGHHAGHMGDDGTGETHYTVAIESAAFEGLNRVARQRLVNRALADLLAGPVHALAIRARAPGEA